MKKLRKWTSDVLRRWWPLIARRWPSLVYLAVAIVVITFAATSKGFENCRHDRENERGDQKPSRLLVLVDFSTCVVRVADRHNGTLVALFTLTLWLTTQATLGHLEREFLATHRPRLALRRATFDRITAEHPQGQPRIRVEIANTGDAAAVVAGLAIVLLPVTGTPIDLPARLLEAIADKGQDDTMQSRIGERIPNGGSYEFIIRSVAVDEAIATESGAKSPRMFTVYCIGYIEYTDDRGQNPRRMGFIRHADLSSRQFTCPDRTMRQSFEYQD